MNLSKLESRDVFALVIGLCLSIKIRIIGTFSLSEFLLMLFYFSTSMKSFKRDSNCRKMIGYAILWLIGTCIANYANNINMMDSFKGIFFLVVFIILIPPVYALFSEKPERILLFFLGMGVSSLYMKYFAQTEQVAEMWNADVYRFYAYASLIAGISYYIYFKGRYSLAIIIMEAVSIVGLFYASRNLFLTTTLGAILLIVISKMRGKMDTQINSFRRRIPMYLVAGLIGVVVVDVVYEQLAKERILGDDAYYKYVTQSEGGNLLEGGRAEFFMGLELVRKKPIVGWGSYAKDTWGFRADYAMRHNRIYHDPVSDYDYLPAHSWVVGAWMQNGILGAIFWFYILILLWKIFKSGCLLCEPRILGLLIFQIVAMLWNWAFSPFGDRVSFLVLMLTLMVIYRNYNTGLYRDRPYEIQRLKI